MPPAVLLIPRFLVLKETALYNSYPGMILPLIADATGIFLMRQFFVQIPVSIEEAARIDGAGIFRTYWSVVLPLARPGLITLTILSFQGSWNEFQMFLIATSDPKYNTLTTGLAKFSTGQLGAGTQYPVDAGRGAALDDPCRDHLLPVPETVRRRTALLSGQGLTLDGSAPPTPRRPTLEGLRPSGSPAGRLSSAVRG